MKKFFSRRFFAAVLALLALLALAGCTDRPEDRGGKMKTVTAAVPPVAFLVKAVAGDNFRVNVLLPEGKNPHECEIGPAQIAALNRSSVLFYTGLPFEKRPAGAVAGRVPVIDLSQKIAMLPAAAEHEAEDGHGHAHAHGCCDGENDPHIWFSPVNAAVMCDAIADALAAADPENAAVYRERAAAVKQECGNIRRELAVRLKKYENCKFYVYHPSFGYFGRDFKLIQQPLEIGGREMPLPALTRLIRQAKAENVKLIFVQPSFNRSSAEALAKGIGGSVAVADPLQYDLFKAFRELGSRLEKAY